MRPLYAVQFEISRKHQDGTSSPNGISPDVLSQIGNWISDWYSARKDIKIEFPYDGGNLEPASGHSLSVKRAISKVRNASHTIISWSYPDDNDGNILWHSKCEIGEFQGLTEFSFQLILESIQFVISPVEFRVRRPRIVGTLIRAFRCQYGDSALTLEPRTLTAVQVPDFVSQVLRSTQRRLPVVVVSRNSLTNKWIVDPAEVADVLAGIAETYVLEDKWAAFALSDEVGKMYSCYNGAVRIYWPDFDPDAMPYSPVYLPEKLALNSAKLLDSLFRYFSTIATVRFTTGPVTLDATEVIEEERQRETEELKLAAKDRGDYEELLSISDDDNKKLREQVNSLQDELYSARNALALSQDNIRAIFQAQEKQESEDSGQIEGTADYLESGPDNVESVVLLARNAFNDTLVFTDAALNSSTTTPYKQPKRVQQALLALHEVCLAWRGSRKTKKTMGSFEDAFQARSFEYKPRESMTSKGKWANEYETIYKGERVSIEQHLALGKGGPDTCLRIHFFIDESEEKFVVDHVGRHKTNTKT